MSFSKKHLLIVLLIQKYTFKTFVLKQAHISNPRLPLRTKLGLLTGPLNMKQEIKITKQI